MYIAVGLCARCSHCQVLKSPRGSQFYLCLRHRVDPAYRRYPALPVLSCKGYQDQTPTLGEVKQE